MLLRVVAVTARMTTELEELKRSRNSRSVWKLHADSLGVLVHLAQRLADAVDRLALIVGQQPIGQDLETQANRDTLHSSLEGCASAPPRPHSSSPRRNHRAKKDRLFIRPIIPEPSSSSRR